MADEMYSRYGHKKRRMTSTEIVNFLLEKTNFFRPLPMKELHTDYQRLIATVELQSNDDVLIHVGYFHGRSIVDILLTAPDDAGGRTIQWKVNEVKWNKEDIDFLKGFQACFFVAFKIMDCIYDLLYAKVDEYFES